MKPHLECIVPFYNEGERILTVAQALSRVPSISRVICVDDGSTDTAHKKIIFPKTTVIRNKKNYGKTHAIFLGLKHVTSDAALLFDGDLVHPKPEEIDNAIQKYFATPQLDMLILRARGISWHVVPDMIFRSYVVQSGLRILKTKDLREVSKLPISGYQIEVAMNQYMMDHKKRVMWYPISSINLLKTQKYSISAAWTKDFAMDREIMSYLGPMKRLYQILFFARQKLL